MSVPSPRDAALADLRGPAKVPLGMEPQLLRVGSSLHGTATTGDGDSDRDAPARGL